MPRSAQRGKEILKYVWRKSNGRCAHCGGYTSGKERTSDHFVPISEGGTNDKRNLLPLCKTCNKKRKSYQIDPQQFYQYASLEAIQDCINYQNEWLQQHTNSVGHVIGSEFWMGMYPNR